MSCKTCRDGIITFLIQSGPVQVSWPLMVCGWQMCSMASGAVQIKPTELT